MICAGFAQVEFVFEVAQGFVVDAAVVAQPDGAAPFQLKQVAGYP